MSKPRYAEVQNTGTCEWCGEVLVQRDDEPYCNWRKRRTCNKAHAALLRERGTNANKLPAPAVKVRFQSKPVAKPGGYNLTDIAARYQV